MSEKIQRIKIKSFVNEHGATITTLSEICNPTDVEKLEAELAECKKENARLLRENHKLKKWDSTQLPAVFMLRGLQITISEKE
jgi:hypothetical protein